MYYILFIYFLQVLIDLLLKIAYNIKIGIIKEHK